MPPKKVLIVEDDTDWQERIRGRIEGLGYKVALAGNIVEARDKISPNPQDYALILLDPSLTESGDDREGLVFLDQVRDRGVQTPCVLLTANLTKELAKDAINDEKYEVVGLLEKEDFVMRPAFVTKTIKRAIGRATSPTSGKSAAKAKKERSKREPPARTSRHSSSESTPEYRIQLLDTLKARLDKEDLQDLCFTLKIDYDDLAGEGKVHKARELVRYLERHDRIRDLIVAGKRLRPDIPWDDALQGTPETRPTFHSASSERLPSGKMGAITAKKIRSKREHSAGSTHRSLPTSKRETKVSAKRSREKYVDFDLQINRDGSVHAYSDQGERTTTISPILPNDIGLTVGLIEEEAINEDLLKEFGKRLYGIIFPDRIDVHFNQTEVAARGKKSKTRIRLVIKLDALAGLPWEFTYREEGGYFLAVNPQTVLSRYLDLPLPRNRVRRREGPLNMLTIVANPSDQTPLNPDEWETIITKALDKPIKEQLITVKTVKRATRREISKALLDQKPDIVQFVGHGIYRNGKGYLALVEEETGKTWELDDERFANIFLAADENLGLMSLATCESAKTSSPQKFLGIAPQLVERGVPAVVAMQYSVRISTAKIFLEEFYSAVAARKPVDWAVQWARNQISLQYGLGNREFATPVLYMRAKDGNIF